MNTNLRNRVLRLLLGATMAVCLALVAQKAWAVETCCAACGVCVCNCGTCSICGPCCVSGAGCGDCSGQGGT